MTKGPVLIDLEEEDAPAPSVTDAPPVPDAGRAMQLAAQVAARPPSRLSRWFWGLLLAVIGAMVSVAAWDFVNGLLARVPMLGWAVSGLLGALVLVGVILVIRELAALGRLRRVDGLRQAASQALAAHDLNQARAVTDRIERLYKGREDTTWGLQRLAERKADQFDADALMQLIEDEVLAPLDAAASREVEQAARQVATVTALVPIALADVITALAASVRMIRRIAEIYGGRAGLLGSWRLTRAVFTHLVATGAVAVGDDLLEPLLGGSLLSKLSRRFGEGLVNGALSARVGVAAMEVCRPLPFSKRHKPAVRSIVKRALSSVFSRS
ncbi:YcjF family protein [Ruegeria sp. 2012CJ41-6]|uniref:YcjF family protein n=1 Tax=Ruegeria spongiae TaxID=2942209 RepID=A0ABT0Q3V6_9RHOB|nr:TIGR01620 family protein [Ruegeria spongiae]MCL6283858.1 YcjF family protein [Ruegeria spongiae]